MITCLICNRSFQAINVTHLKQHGLKTIAEYRQLYPEAPIISQELHQKFSANALLQNSQRDYSSLGEKVSTTKAQRKLEGKDYGEALRGIPKSEEHKHALAKSIQASFDNGRVHWATGTIMPNDIRAKISETCKEYEPTDEHREKHKLAMQNHVNRDDYVNSMRGKEHNQKTKDMISKRGLANRDKIRAIMEAKGKWLPLELVDDLTIYKRVIWSLTKQVQHLIPGYDEEKRGRCKLDTDNHQVDHIFSIVEGFKQGVAPEVIAALPNLRFIPWQENLAKFSRSDITLDELSSLLEATTFAQDFQEAQEPLRADFEKVLFDNLWELYE